MGKKTTKAISSSNHSRSTWESKHKITMEIREVQGYQARSCEKGIMLKGMILKAQKITEWSKAKRWKAELRAKHGVKCRIPQKLGMLRKGQKHYRNWLHTRKRAETRATNIQEEGRSCELCMLLQSCWTPLGLLLTYTVCYEVFHLGVSVWYTMETCIVQVAWKNKMETET